MLNKAERVEDGRNLLENLALIVQGTWETAPQVYKAHLAGEYTVDVVTNNMPVYRLIDGEPTIALVGPEGNLLADKRFQKQAYEMIMAYPFFQPEGKMLEHVLRAIEAGQAVEVPYSGLSLETDSESGQDHCYVETGARNSPHDNRLIEA